MLDIPCFSTAPRRDRPFEPINCSALSDDLLESRLFGFKKGSFTGADEDRVGILEAAEGGTVFLDEIGDISSYMQQVLLRVIQEKEIAPIGGPRRKIDVRFLSATNQDMKQRCEQGRFRWDLYYRLAVIDLKLPPMQQWVRPEVKKLIQFLLEYKQRQFLRPHPLQLAPLTLELLLAYPFPGNIRELENLIERLYVLCQDERVGPEHLPESIVQAPAQASLKLKDVERQHIERVLRRNGHNQRQTARDLGVALNTLRSKIKGYGIEMQGQ
jgi:two-component system, NtrC family, response regulator HydG